MTIAGSDPSGGAGIQADLKTFHQFGVYGEAVITLLTVQNTVGVEAVECLSPELILRQARAVLADIPPAAVKTGALGNGRLVEAVAELAGELEVPLVVDPVMISKHGAPLMDAEARHVLVSRLIPKAFLLTPNMPEAAALAGFDVPDVPAMRRAAATLHDLGARAVLVKGGHLAGEAVDVLFDGRSYLEFPAPRIDTPHTHGTGCTYSAAIAAMLARRSPLQEAVAAAKAFLTAAIRTNPGLGHGSGPVNHFALVRLG